MTYKEYLQIAKDGDKILLGGIGIMDGLKNRAKSFVYNVIKSKNGDVYLRLYNRRKLSIIPESFQNQEVEIITEKEFKSMPIY